MACCFYAKTKGAAFDDAKIRHRDGYSIYIRTLDLNTDFESIKKRLETFPICKSFANYPRNTQHATFGDFNVYKTV
jgi:hypothetical protein